MSASAIDMVFLWVDDSDPVWREKRDKALVAQGKEKQPNLKGRYADNGELKFALRSVEKHLPWIRNIYIVTDNQQPKWLDLKNERIRIIDHKDIMPADILPSFNAGVIERCIYRIPGLSEQFLYANDDMFVNDDLHPDFFFNSDGLPIIRLQLQPIQRTEFFLKTLFGLPVNTYRQSIENTIRLIKAKYSKYYPGVAHHNIDGYLKTDFRAVMEQDFKEEMKLVSKNQFRAPNDIQRVLFSYSALAKCRGHKKFVKREESLRIRVHKPGFMEMLNKYSPSLFCLNDTEHATDADRARIRPFLEALFPEKSSFEL